MEFILSAGDQTIVLDIPTRDGVIRMGTPICFEATVSGVCRELVFDENGRRADILVNLTNDGWFMDWDPSRRTHMLIARWRCIELGTPMIRSANTGVSCVIDQNGGVVQDHLSRVDPDDSRMGYLNASVQLGTREPFRFTGLISSMFSWGLLGLTGLGMIMSFVQKRSEIGRASCRERVLRLV